GRGAGLQPVVAARLAGAAAAQAAGHAGRAADPAGTPAQGHDAALPPVAPRGLAAARGGVVRDSGLPAARTAGVSHLAQRLGAVPGSARLSAGAPAGAQPLVAAAAA